MTPPRLNRRLALEVRVRVADGAGGFSEAWAERGRLWAEVVPGSGIDSANEEIATALMPYRITVRGAAAGAASRPVVAERFRDGTRAYLILAVAERDAAGQYLTCHVRQEEPV